MEVVILGTSAMVPTKDRNQSAILLKYKDEGLLFDCGEGTQRQLKIVKEKITKITKIFISHLHGDHILGIPGIVQTLNSSKFEDENLKIEIYGPKGAKESLTTFINAIEFDQKIDIQINEIKEGVILDKQDFKIECYKLDHTILSYGYKFVEKDKRKVNMAKAKKLGLETGPKLGKLQRGETVTHKNKTIDPDDVTYIVEGKKMGYIADTAMCNGCLKIAEDCDLVISECTYHSKEEEKAEKYKHLTAEQVASIANKANAKKLILTHFSQRYRTVETLENEAKVTFPDTQAAFDGMRIKI
jgi:ribonuclease Z